MCGFAGLFTPGGFRDQDAQEIIRRMSQTLVHRGPDDGGVWVDVKAGVAFGHRRLAIIDLSPQGHQPMHGAGGRYTIAFNGEIYNFKRLRKELEALGHHFLGHSDTEVFLAAIFQWGLEEALKRANGMFAFALWDAQLRVLSLARDRVGEKPLYYSQRGNTWLFGSELKALCQHPGFTRALNHEAIELFFRLGYVPVPHTPFQEAHSLIPGTILSISADHPADSPMPRPYWSATSVMADAVTSPWEGGSFHEAQEALEELLLEAVGLRMVADVPLGAFLSGGIDSSLVVALMQAQSLHPIRTFTVGFDEQSFDESSYAAAIARHLGTQHTELRVSGTEALAAIPRMTDLYDGLLADASQIPTYLISALTKKHVTVSLSGDAGDELFGGYGRYVHAGGIRRRLHRWPYGVRALLSTPVRWAGMAASRTSRRYQPLKGRAQKAALMLTSRSGDDFYASYLARAQDVTIVKKGLSGIPSVFNALAADLPSCSFQEQMMFLDFLTYLPDDILVKVDRAGMGVSLETRIPFLDPRVIEFAWKLPMEWKMKGTDGKWVLRRLLDRYVPPALMERPKMGFGVPLGKWLRGPLRGWAEELLEEGAIRSSGVLNGDVVRDTWRSHMEGPWDRSTHLWDILMFQGWWKKYGLG